MKNKAIDQHGYPIPRKEQCFRCRQLFWLKFVLSTQNYSQKNNWGYWTNQAKDKLKWICNSCLRKFYGEERENFLATVKDLKKKKSFKELRKSWDYLVVRKNYSNLNLRH